MTSAKRAVPAPTLDEQIAAIEDCLEVSRGVLRTVGGHLPELRRIYQLRIDRLEAALLTLKAAQR